MGMNRLILMSIVKNRYSIVNRPRVLRGTHSGTMVQESRPCPDVLVQIAVRGALDLRGAADFG